MSYAVEVGQSAAREIKALPVEIRPRIVAAIAALAEEPRPTGAKKLKGREGWRVRVGDFRIVYTIEDEVLVVLVVRVRHRKDVYR